jgi:hypothetical protein
LSYRTEYFETVDYTWALARQLDRVAEAYTSIDPKTPGIGLRRLVMAVRALYALARIFAPREGLEALARAEALARGGRPLAGLSEIDRALESLLRVLYNKGLLIRKQELPVGSFGGGE